MGYDEDTLLGGNKANFPTTIWSSVFETADRKSERFRQKVETLLSRYWKPVYRTIRITWGKNNEDAKDLTQSFLVMVIEDDLMKRFCPEKGRFRSFLKAALGYFLSDEEKARRRIKRGGGRAHLSLDAEPDMMDIDPADKSRSPEEILDREWADNLLEESIRELQDRLSEEGRDLWYRVYEAIDLAPTSEGSLSYREAAKRLKISESDVTHYLHAARRRLRSILIERIGEYANTEDEIYDELNQIFSG